MTALISQRWISKCSAANYTENIKSYIEAVAAALGSHLQGILSKYLKILTFGETFEKLPYI